MAIEFEQYKNLAQRLNSDDAIKTLTDAIKNTKPTFNNRSILEKLKAEYEELIGPTIVKLILDKDPAVQQEAIELSEKYHFAESQELMPPTIAKLLQDKDPRMQQEAVKLSEKYHFEEAIPNLLEILQSNDAYLQRDAAKALVSLDVVEPVIDYYIARLQNKDNFMARMNAADNLGAMRAKRAIPSLMAALNDEDATAQSRTISAEDASAQSSIISALGLLGAKKAIPDIIPLLKSYHQHVRHSAIEALENLKISELPDQINRMIYDSDHDVQIIAKRLIASFARQRPTIDTLEVNEDIYDEPASNVEMTETIAELIKLLEDEDGDERYTALHELGEMNAIGLIIPQLIALLQDDDRRVRHLAVWTIGDVEIVQAAPYLTPMLKDKESNSQLLTVQAITKIEKRRRAAGLRPSSEATSALKQALTVDSIGARYNAAWELIDFGPDDEAVTQIMNLLDTDSEIDAGSHRALQTQLYHWMRRNS